MGFRFIRDLSHTCLLAGAIALLLTLGACGGQETIKEENLPELVLTDLDNAQVSTQTFRGKLLVLNVWASWCPPCRGEMPGLEQLSKSVDSGQIVVIGMSVDIDANLAREFLGQNKITFRNFIDDSGKNAKTLGVSIYPETLLVTPDGKIAYRVKGERDWGSPAMLHALQEIYQGKRSGFDSILTGSLAQ